MFINKEVSFRYNSFYISISREDCSAHYHLDVDKMDINMKSKSHSQQLLTICWSHEEADPGHSVMMVTGDSVGTTSLHLWLLSPFIRSVMNSIKTTDQHLIILPDFTSEELGEALEVIKFPEPDVFVFNEVTKNILDVIGIDIKYEEQERDLDDSETDTDSQNYIQCMCCPEQIRGGKKKLREHLILSHLKNEIELEVSEYFGSSDQCKKCQKLHLTVASKEKHLSYEHSYLVEKIDKLMEKINHRENPEDIFEDIRRKMDEISDSDDSDDSDDTEDENHSDDESSEAIQNQLMMCNPNLSDSDTEEEDDDIVKEEKDDKDEVHKILMQYHKNLDDTDSDSESEDSGGDNIPISESEAKPVSNNEKIDEAINKSSIDEKIDEEIDNLLEKTSDGYRCKACGKRSKNQHDLRRHIESHLKGYSHPCNECDAVMPTRNARIVHMKKKHGAGRAL